MKKLTLIILAAALAATTANADDYYLCYTGAGDQLYFAKIPGPGTHYSLDIVHQIPIPSNSDALTYDGENWWIYNENADTIYCFDQNGDYVSEFPAPGASNVTGLGWDGQYLWIDPVGLDTCTRDIYGNPGPYGPFWAGILAHTVVDDVILGGDYAYGDLPSAFIYAHDFYGNFLYLGALAGGYTYAAWTSLAYHEGIVWASAWYDDSDHNYHYYTSGYYYDDDGDWDWYGTILDFMVNDLTICDADFINISEASLGQIKAYFADK